MTNLYEGYSAEEIFNALGAKPLNTKKNILEYIDQVRKLAKDGLAEEQVKAVYEWIEAQIEAMGNEIKINTMVYLKNELRTKLGKFAAVSKGEENAFVRFYKQTFANQVKTKEYTYALMDLSRLNEASVLETLKTINTYCLRNKLSAKEKEDIMPMIKRIVDTQNLRLVNQVRSMEGIRKNFRIKIVEVNKRLVIQNV
ncbi:MAG: hypothetical protein J6F30_08370 [Cellulosilyticum sp.]|nr:hypothetical protein [Cellulosilyticum sp.]